MDLPEMNTLPQLVAYWENLLEKEKIKQNEQKEYCIAQLKQEMDAFMEKEKHFKELIQEQKQAIYQKEKEFEENRKIELEDLAAKLTEKYSDLLEGEEEYRYIQMYKHGQYIKELKKNNEGIINKYNQEYEELINEFALLDTETSKLDTKQYFREYNDDCSAFDIVFDSTETKVTCVEPPTDIHLQKCIKLFDKLDLKNRFGNDHSKTLAVLKEIYAIS